MPDIIVCFFAMLAARAAIARHDMMSADVLRMLRYTYDAAAAIMFTFSL